VSVFDRNGNLLQYLIPNGPLNSPGAVASAPRGLLRAIAPPSAITKVANAASWQTGPVSPRELIDLARQTVGTTAPILWRQAYLQQIPVERVSWPQ